MKRIIKNKKGVTIIELLISILLMGLVLTFLTRVLSDLKQESVGTSFAFNNQVNRMELIYTIQNDLNSHFLVSITDKSYYASGFNIEFNFKNGYINNTAVLSSSKTTTHSLLETIDTYYITYKDFNGVTHKWEMVGGRASSCFEFTSYIDKNSNNYYFRIDIPIYNNPDNDFNNEENNNLLDDIGISFAGNITSGSNSLITSNNQLLTYCAFNQNYCLHTDEIRGKCGYY